MVIAHNISAMNSNRQLGIVGGEMAKSVQKLSSGYRINKAADDAAGLSISEKMRRQIRGLTKGVENSEDGISLCQVADGALNEVHEMLQRMNELAVKAANGTNSTSDRNDIEKEITQLISEIDRIGDTTKFNEVYVFRGDSERTFVKKAGSNTNVPTIINPTEVPAPTFDQVTMDCKLDEGPFNQYSDGGHLGLSATGTTGTYSETWPLIYGDGSTSNPAIQGTYISSGTITSFRYELTNLRPSNYSATQSGNDKIWSRTFSFTKPDGLDLQIIQKVNLHTKQNNNQYYTVSYDLVNNSNFEVNCNMIHHEDTAYANKDYVECYYLNGGSKVEKSSMYTTSASIAAGITNTNVHNSVPSDFSIVNESDALCFTESIVIDSGAGSKADTLIIGQFGIVGSLTSYTDADMNYVLGDSTNGMDLGFSLVWSDRNLAANGGNTTLAFNQGIVALENDTNIPNTITKAPTIIIGGADDKDPVTVKTAYAGNQNLWIQSGCDTLEGLSLQIGAMNSVVLNIDDISVMTEKNADDAIVRIADAIKEVSRQRSRLGAYQNRLEHTIANENNVIENTTASESTIRDTDMATEMVRYSNKNVLKQVGETMLAQANQSNQGVLALVS